MSPSTNASISKRYQKKDLRTHIYDRTDTYAGSATLQKQFRGIFNEETDRIVKKEIDIVPALYKIIDEIIVNTRDHQLGEATLKNIWVSVDQDTGVITVQNDGNGFPIIQHDKHKIWIPTLCIGHLLTSTNYDPNIKRVTGGLNGYGAKVTNILSKWLKLETAHSKQKLKFSQKWSNNMKIAGKPKVEKCTAKQAKEIGTMIQFLPDYERFGIEGITDDMFALLQRRAYDIAATTDKRVTVHFNGEPIKVRNFEDYVNMYIGDKKETPRVYREFSDRWRVCVAFKPDDEYQAVSFVNGIETYLGGEHVEYITNQLVRKLTAKLREKSKDLTVKPSYIKMKLHVFVDAIVENPAFDSQSKGSLTTKKFGSTCVIDDDFIDKLAKTGLASSVAKFAEHQANQKLARQDGTKKRKVKIHKLEDAIWAGTGKSDKCSLILCEGDSAKTFCISGLSVVGRKEYGVFPLKGKLLNVREATVKQRLENTEICNLKAALGLHVGKNYEDTKSLRYGHLVILTDADDDGSHIAGLVINFLHYTCPSLLKIPGFLKFFKTPIVKAFKGKNTKEFYTMAKYTAWKERYGGKGWEVKYYKGLGTSTAKEAKGYFQNLADHLVEFVWKDDETNDQAIELGFSKTKIADRKVWLKDYDETQLKELAEPTVTFEDFVNHKLIQFSAADNIRSLPNVVDGLKPSYRKVLFCALKKLKNKQLKVAQFAGAVSADSSYHHGEASLMGVIIHLAQDFVGSNNINYLEPKGQFGSRVLAGKDAASPRYIFTQLEKITAAIFNGLDSPLLNYLDDDGQMIEPANYFPVVPMLLINGSDGIGTGYSTFVPPHNPKDVVANLERMMKKQEPKEMKPWFSGSTGEVEMSDTGGSYTGRFERIGDTTIRVTDLPPIGKERATQEYLAFLEKITLENPKDKIYTKRWISDYENFSTDYLVRIEVEFPTKKLLDTMIRSGDFAKKMKLVQTFRTRNMHAFSPEHKIVKYDTTVDILKAYYPVRLDMYQKRKDYLIKDLERQIAVLSNKSRFLKEVSAKTIKLVDRRRRKEQIEADLETRNYLKVKESYDYLLSMPLWSFTDEKLAELEAQIQKKSDELTFVKSQTPEDLWRTDLNEFKAEYKKMLSAREKVFQEELDMEKKRKDALEAKKKPTRKIAKKRKTTKRTTRKK
jgi:DNA topoisomerase-2